MSASDVVQQRAGTIRWQAWLLGVALAASSVAAALTGLNYLAHHVTTDDAFVELPTVYVAGQVPGRVLEVLVEEHQRVEKDQVLVRLDPAEYDLDLARADASLALARNRVVQAEAASASADAERKAATAELWRARRELERVRSLRDQGTVSQADLDTAQATYDATRAKVRALELRVEVEQALNNDDAPVRFAEAEQRAAVLGVERTLIRAPFAGIVGRRNVEPGAVVAAGQPLLALVSTTDASVMANFKETQIERIRIGAPVEVTIDAYPGIVWRGRVESFSPATGAEYALIAPEPAAGNFTKVVQRVPIKIVLFKLPLRSSRPGAPPTLASGLSAEVDVLVE